MAYKSEADQWREAFETMKAQYVTVTILNTDLFEWNKKLADETIRIREANRLLRDENAYIRSFIVSVVWFATLITFWNIVT